MDSVPDAIGSNVAWVFGIISVSIRERSWARTPYLKCIEAEMQNKQLRIVALTKACELRYRPMVAATVTSFSHLSLLPFPATKTLSGSWLHRSGPSPNPSRFPFFYSPMRDLAQNRPTYTSKNHRMPPIFSEKTNPRRLTHACQSPKGRIVRNWELIPLSKHKFSDQIVIFRLLFYIIISTVMILHSIVNRNSRKTPSRLSNHIYFDFSGHTVRFLART